MSNIEKTTKAISTVQLLTGLLGLVKTVGLAVLVLMLEYINRQKVRAEKGKAIAESDLAIEKGKQEISNETAGKSHADIVRDYLARGGPEG